MMQLQFTCPRDEVEAYDAVLENSGALSITLTDQLDSPILEPELGTTPLWPNVVIEALYEDLNAASEAHQMLLTYNANINVSITSLPELLWEQAWTEHVKPMCFGKRLWVCPSHIPAPEANAITITLDPGLAFGTGTHPTTSLCLSWLSNASLSKKTLIDYGCGSGILALAAIKLGALHTYAVDIDEQALTATRNNAQKNDVGLASLTVSAPDHLVQPVDVIVANILLNPLLTLQQRLKTLLKCQGLLVVTGLLEEQVPALLEAYQEDFSHQTTIIQDGWALLSLIKKAK